MTNKNEDLQELFALPINLKLVAKIEGNELYSNDKLKEKYISALENRSETKKVSNKFRKLVDEGYIIPCWLNKGLLKFIAYKIFAPISSKGVMGFFHPDSNKFFIIIDNNVSFGLASNTLIAKLTLHESMHMFAHKTPGKFFKTFEDKLIKWHYHFFVDIFDLDLSKLPKNIDLSKPIKFLFQNSEIKMNVDQSVFKRYRKMINERFKPYTKLDEETFNKRLDELINLPKIYYNNIDNFLQIIKNYKHIIQPMYGAYYTAFGLKGLSTLCIQELLYPSEIISILAESKPDSSVYKGVNQI